LQVLTHSLEEPFGDSSMLPSYYVSRLARQHVTVALSGDAGDELFAGYDRYQVSLGRQKFGFIPSWAGRWYRDHVFPWLPRAVPGRRLAFNLSLPPSEGYLEGITAFQPLHRDKDLFSKDFLASIEGLRDPLDLFRGYLEKAPAQDLLSRLMYLDTKTYLTADILAKVDRMSMAASLEVRVPILDHVFLEWVTGLPVHWKLRNGQEKYIFKKLAKRVGVPPEVVYRPKQGFALPLVHWMRQEMKEELPRLLLEPRSLQRGYFNPQALRELLDEHFRARRDHSVRIWRLLILELWHRNFLEATGDIPRLPLPARLTENEAGSGARNRAEIHSGGAASEGRAH
jgi:asparagine synthase (glutamine-hydrolysing)